MYRHPIMLCRIGVLCFLLAITNAFQNNNVKSTTWTTIARKANSTIIPSVVEKRTVTETHTGHFLDDDDGMDDAPEEDNDAFGQPASVSSRATDSATSVNATSPEGRSFFDDLDISPLGGYKKYSKTYINLAGYTAGKEKVEGGGLMPSPIPVPGVANVPFLTSLGGGGGGLFGQPIGGPVAGLAAPSYIPGSPSYGIGPSQYLVNGAPPAYGSYPVNGPPVNIVAPLVVVRPSLPVAPVGIPVAQNAELGSFISTIRNRPYGPPVSRRPLPPHCKCALLANCRDVSRFARMYTDDDMAYNGQCLPNQVVCCNPELLEQQQQAIQGHIPPPSPVIIKTAGSLPAVIPIPVGGPVLVKQVGLGRPGPGSLIPPPPPPIVSAGGPAVCGRKGKNPMARVLDDSVQRSETEFGEFPWMAAVLLSDLTYVCGGALIGERFILTAAHCISKHKNKNLVVRLGEYDVQETDEPPFHDYKVVEAIIHAGYHSGTLRNDVAILILDIPVKYNAYIAPACLPEPGASYGPGLCTVTGWGKDTMTHGKWSSKLKGVTIPLVTNEFCQNSYRKSPELGNYFNLDSSFICAGAPGKDACFGDGGSPLVCPINGVYQLVGLVSWGIDCGLYPGVYARVEKLLPWILDLTKQHK